MATLSSEMTKEEIIKLFVQGGAQYGVFGPNPFGPGGPFGGSDPAGDPGGGSTMGMGFDNQDQADEYGRLLQDFLNIFRPYVADQDLDDIDRINRQNQAAEFLDVLAEYVKGNATLRDIQGVDVSDLSGMDGWDDYYNDITVVEAPQDWDGIEEILRRNGYAENEIEDIRNSVRCLIPVYTIENGKNVLDGYNIACSDNEQFQGSLVLPRILADLGYEGRDWWAVKPSKEDGNSCLTTDQNGNTAVGTVVNGRCVAEIDAGDGDDSTPDCTVITQENADSCGYEITSDGQLIPKDLSGDPDSYPTYVNCGGGIFAETEEDCPDLEGTGTGIGNCSTINSENADECGYEITSDGQLIPKDLSGAPEDYPNYDSCGNGVFVLEGTECPDVPITYSEEERSTAEAIRDWIEGQIGRIEDMTVDDVLDVIFGGDAWDPTCELTGDDEEIWDCAGTDGTEGNQCWKDCVSVSVLGGIPGLPLPPGAVDIGTVRDLENTVNEVGDSIADVFDAPTGDTDDEGWIQRTKDWVIGKIEDIFGDLDDVTLEDITGWITGILGPVAAGIILQEVEGTTNTVRDKIDDILFGVAPTDDENCIEREYFEANKETCTALGYLDCDASVGEQGQELTGGIIGPDQTTEGCQEIQDPQCIKDGKWDGEKCVCPEGSDLQGQEEPLSGDCSDDGGDDTTVEEDCPEGSEVENPQYDFYDLQNTGTYNFGGQTYEYDPCNPSQPHTVVTGGGDDGCTGGQKKFDGENCEDPCPTNSSIGISNPACVGDGGGGDVYDPDCATDPRPTGPLTFELQEQQAIWDRKCGGTTPPTTCQDQNATNRGEDGPCECPPGFVVSPDGTQCLETGGCTPRGEVIDYGCDGTTFYIRMSSGEIDPNTGECGEIYDTVPNYSGCAGGGICNDPNAVNDGEEGTCECKPGFVKGNDGLCFQSGDVCDNGATVESGCDTCPDGTSVFEYEDGQCPTSTPPQDCSDPAYAAANPEECFPSPPPPPPPPPPSGGGGGSVGGGVGAFSPFIAGIDYTPQPLPAAPAAPQKDYMAELDNLIKRNLFEGIV